VSKLYYFQTSLAVLELTIRVLSHTIVHDAHDATHTSMARLQLLVIQFTLQLLRFGHLPDRLIEIILVD